MILRAIKILRTLALMVYVFLLIVHFIIKDHFRIFQVPFYAFSLPILVVGSVIITILFYRPKSYFIFFMCMTIGLTGVWFNNSYVFPRSVTIPEEAISVLFWNAADKPTIHRAIISDQIKSYQPEIIALAETKNATDDDLGYFLNNFPNYEFQILQGDMMIGIKGHIEQIDYVVEPYSYDINFVQAHLSTGPILIAFTDTFQNPMMDKKTTLETVLHLVSERDADLIVGDFNTPYESVHFRNYEIDYESFRDYGQGFSATWPFGIPLLELDQLYVRKELTPLQLQKFYYNVSDHAMLIGVFTR